ncbi:hypothetical protein FBUS_07739 [Fasciolopsis buskii]|uniref:Uncharacterized protein n=1 Tax=Fasciolopsis buskii TaxID=27845 RepID=A0A8E0RS32_9TREM|nr:hypothetical protein FBUS_07739 [Fasciolopsis buski]
MSRQSIFTAVLFLLSGHSLFAVTGFSFLSPTAQYGYYDDNTPEIAPIYRKFSGTYNPYGTPVNYISVREMRPTLVPIKSTHSYGLKHAYLSKPKIEYTIIRRTVQQLRIPVPAKKDEWDAKLFRYRKPERRDYNYDKNYDERVPGPARRFYERREILRY